MPSFGVWEWAVVAGCWGSVVVAAAVLVIAVVLLVRKVS